MGSKSKKTSSSRNKNIVACFLFLIKDNQVLLLKRQNTGYRDGQYSLISGHVDAGESFTQAMIREAREEAGLELAPADLRVVHVMHRRSSVDQSERVDVYFLASSWRSSPANCEPGKCAELAWFDRDKLPEETVPYIRKVLTALNRRQIYSERGWQQLSRPKKHDEN